MHGSIVREASCWDREREEEEQWRFTIQPSESPGPGEIGGHWLHSLVQQLIDPTASTISRVHEWKYLCVVTQFPIIININIRLLLTWQPRLSVFVSLPVYRLTDLPWHRVGWGRQMWWETGDAPVVWLEKWRNRTRRPNSKIHRDRKKAGGGSTVLVVCVPKHAFTRVGD